MTLYNPMDLTGKTIVITGAASGIGKATAILLSKLNANLILLDINEKGLNDTKSQCKPDDFIGTVDLTDESAVETILKEAVSIRGKVNGFAHIAGIPSIAPIKAITKKEAQRILEINTLPALYLAKILSNKKYKAEESCSFVLISSVYANVGSSANVIYTMSKAAIQRITKSLAIEFAPKKIRVNCVAPGFIKTPMGEKINHFFDYEHDTLIESMHPLGLGTPEDIANSIAFLLSDASKWTTGAIFNIDGGFCAQ